MPSVLTFQATEALRNALLARNLPPYNVDGAFSSPPPPYTYEYNQSNYSVQDISDHLIDEGINIVHPYTWNKYVSDPAPHDTASLSFNTLTPINGPYDINSADLLLKSGESLLENGLYNIFTPMGGVFSPPFSVSTTLPFVPPQMIGFNQPYWSPPSFGASFYSPYDLFMGIDGSLSEDSMLAQNNATAFRTMMQYRIQQELYTETFGRLNFLDAINDPTDWVSILEGRTGLIERDNRITVPQSLAGKGIDFLSRLGGTYYPSSPIPGDYFDEPDRAPDDSSAIGRILTGIGDFFGIRGRMGRSSSQLFVDNTGGGHKKALSKNISWNKYRPQYVSNTAGSIPGMISRTLGVQFPDGKYYVGDVDTNPSFLASPYGEIPLAPDGTPVDAIVYGPDVTAKKFSDGYTEPIGQPTTIDGGPFGGEVFWRSGGSSVNTGKKVGKSGDVVGTYDGVDERLDEISSDNMQFRPGSIMDQTQRLIEAQPKNASRFRHAGYIIDQVSKVFNDGYTEMTKGSKVISYVDENGIDRGAEYGRVFAKDRTYSNISALQKTDGNIRGYGYSVLDKTYNLNIAPYKGENSSNIVDGQVKKYMFSLENLAWRTSSVPGFRVQDLPLCEKGPNGGRIMWFPPYDLNFSESSRPEFATHVFLGRPEPVYTYKSTSRSGSLTWKVVVDHPSVLNMIVNKTMKNDSDKEQTNSLLESFFAGCKKYDLYDLALKYPFIPVSELQKYQNMLNDPGTSNENVRDIYRELDVDGDNSTEHELGGAITLFFPTLNESLPLDPGKNYRDYYENYIVQMDNYGQSEGSITFINIEVMPKMYQLDGIALNIFNELKNDPGSVVDIRLKPTLYPPGAGSDTATIQSVVGDDPSTKGKIIENYFREFQRTSGNETIGLSGFFDEGRIHIIIDPELSDNIATSAGVVDCTDNMVEDMTDSSVTRMACNSMKITGVTARSNGKEKQLSPVTTNADQTLLTEGLSKKILRSMLSECDYFEMVREEDPFVYDSIKQKLKYFQPAFHSTTPEGLNSRLTFLQQCVRPGETIPVIGTDGELKRSGASNTAFGTPPVLVLRIGDFFHTKVIPTSLDIKYEQLDINPEGIGVQPMIASITMGVNFIGGHGLKEPVERLQNALSFNYYANTEMYDERAVATEDTSKYDKLFADNILNATTNVVEDGEAIINDGGQTIGTIVGEVISGGIEKGDMDYAGVLNSFISSAENYFNASINMTDTLLGQYNMGVIQTIMKDRNYNSGKMNATTVRIVGASNKVQENINELFLNLEKDIKNGSLKIFNMVSGVVPSSDIREFKKNYLSIVDEMKSGFTDLINTNLKTLTDAQLDMVGISEKLNYIFDRKADGKIIEPGNVKTYRLVSQHENFLQLITDHTVVVNKIDDFYTELLTSTILSPPFKSSSGFMSTQPERNEYMVMSEKILSSPTTLAELLGQNVTNDMQLYIDDVYGITLPEEYAKERDDERTRLAFLRSNSTDYINFNPIPGSSPELNVPYEVTTSNAQDRDLLITLYDDVNRGGNKTYNGKKKFN